MRLLPLIPLLQVGGAISTLRRVRRWRQDLTQRPSRGHLWGEQILLPLIPNLALISIGGYLRSSGLIRFLDQYMPDLSWIVRISSGFAWIWAPLRTRLILRSLRKPG